MYRGVYTALVTPFTRKGEVDEKALTNLVENQIASGVDGLVPIGTTGESPTLSHREVIGIVELVLKQTAGRIPVIVGTGSNDTKKAIELTREAESLGAQGSLQVTPYYNKPTQEGLYRHFSSIAEATSLPIILYNIPGRSGVPIALDTLKRLVSQAGIKAVKEASGDISGIMSSIAALGDKLDFLSGDDNLTLPIMALGGTGVISVLSNLFPKEVKKMVDLASAGNMEEARSMHYRLLPLFRMVFVETNPIPIKAAMAMQGLLEESYRLPLGPPGESARRSIEDTLKAYTRG